MPARSDASSKSPKLRRSACTTEDGREIPGRAIPGRIISKLSRAIQDDDAKLQGPADEKQLRDRIFLQRIKEEPPRTGDETPSFS